MITNAHQYKVARRALLTLRANAERAGSRADGNVGADRLDIEQRIVELKREVELYESLQTGNTHLLGIGNLEALADLLIGGRIARGMTQKDLADFLGLKMQQIQKYESDRYQSASLRRVTTIVEALGLDVHQAGGLVGRPTLGATDLSRPAAFPLGDMYKRGWLAPFGGTILSTSEAATQHLARFFARAFGDHQGPRRRYARSVSPPHEPAISAWEARIMILAGERPSSRVSMPSLVNEDWLARLVGLTRERHGARLARDYLAEIGISLIVEDPLPGMRLDGAALKTTSGRLVVGLTLRDTRLEMFWFTLMHLVAHIVLHVGQNHYDAIFDELDAPADTAIEEDADTFARELLVPSGKWAKCKSQYCWTRKSIVEDACRLGVGPAVIEGHIRRLYGDARVQPRLTPNIDVRKLLKP
ncbi:ImmA/IrrE family metallo-endopeptidase [uncultured Bradyrhizobium sp.]|nr:XRE family transcriptional regulator [uncultured Bradyrhizobium sp.]